MMMAEILRISVKSYRHSSRCPPFLIPFRIVALPRLKSTGQLESIERDHVAVTSAGGSWSLTGVAILAFLGVLHPHGFENFLTRLAVDNQHGAPLLLLSRQ